MHNFTKAVLEIVSKIPKGKTLSYKEVATLAGNPLAARAVGSIMRKNRDLTIPCHRVITASGAPGSYNGLRGASKEELLRGEK
ncbi:6-O-methylguanine DNA methyltransferase [Candidatus Peregrinibacteria bacterium CG10_big_fil_rev_8_21_14_0_10_36_19]|nr:MAG: 6-O-methylguanine DNA methyltransferase [Candidatus Peregrinibacteria bacterium CG10_big_fil_rev_8_21_14_0_10_36_19]